MISGVRFRALLSKDLRATARVWIGHQRYVKNAKVRERKERWKAGLEADDNQKYSHLITPESIFLKDVPSQLLRNGAVRYMTGLARFKAGLGGAPKVKKRHGRQSVLITRELFRFIPIPTPTGGKRAWAIELGTVSNPIGRFEFIAHREWDFPKQIVLSVEPDDT